MDFAKRSTFWVWLQTDLKSACIFTLKDTFKKTLYPKTRLTTPALKRTERKNHDVGRMSLALNESLFCDDDRVVDVVAELAFRMKLPMIHDMDVSALYPFRKINIIRLCCRYTGKIKITKFTKRHYPQLGSLNETFCKNVGTKYEGSHQAFYAYVKSKQNVRDTVGPL